MTEEDKAWLAGIFDLRGVISITRSRNIIGTVMLKLGSEQLRDRAVSLIQEEGIDCNTVQTIGKTFVINFTSTRGTALLQLILSHLKSTLQIRRAAVYVEVFPTSSKGKHMKVNRLDGYVKWLRLLKEENDDLISAIPR